MDELAEELVVAQMSGAAEAVVDLAEELSCAKAGVLSLTKMLVDARHRLSVLQRVQLS